MISHGRSTPSGIKVNRIRFPDFEVSWAGENPWNSGLIFGSDQGQLKTTGRDLRVLSPFPERSSSGEAINGIAFTDRGMALSTRRDVTFFDRGPDRLGPGTMTTFEGGAHGIVASPSGRFLAPLGPGGLLIVRQVAESDQPMGISSPTDRSVVLQKLVLLSATGPEDRLACASGRGGITSMIVNDQGVESASSFRAPGLDVVDVCSPLLTGWPNAAIGLGADNSFHFRRDCFDGFSPKTLSFPDLKGTGYTILSARGHLFLLTSEGLYAFPMLVNRYLDDEPLDGPTKCYFTPVRAVDVYLAHEDLLVVTADEVQVWPIETLISPCRSGTESATMAFDRLSLAWSPSSESEWTPLLAVA